MSEKLFIVVINKSDYRKDTYMQRLHNEGQVLTHIGNLEMAHKVERVFSVDEFGKVEFYDVVFNGRLSLQKKKEDK